VELLTFTIAATETKRFEVAGRYLEIIDSADRLNIDFNGPDGNRVDSMRGALSGFYSEEPFGAFEVTNPGAVAQVVTLMITDRRGGSRRQPGNVIVVDSIPASVGSYTQASGLAVGFNAVQILDPALNVRGFVIRSLSGYAQSGAGGAMNMRFVAQATAPTNTAAGAARLWLADVLSSNSVIERFQFPDLKKIIPPGWGIWTVTSVATVAGLQGQHFLSGELL
jgi:hypothetical protein